MKSYRICWILSISHFDDSLQFHVPRLLSFQNPTHFASAASFVAVFSSSFDTFAQLLALFRESQSRLCVVPHSLGSWSTSLHLSTNCSCAARAFLFQRATILIQGRNFHPPRQNGQDYEIRQGRLAPLWAFRGPQGRDRQARRRGHLRQAVRSRSGRRFGPLPPRRHQEDVQEEAQDEVKGQALPQGQHPETTLQSFAFIETFLSILS